jgi:hypothetical protein
MSYVLSKRMGLIDRPRSHAIRTHRSKPWRVSMSARSRRATSTTRARSGPICIA